MDSFCGADPQTPCLGKIPTHATPMSDLNKKHNVKIIAQLLLPPFSPVLIS